MKTLYRKLKDLLERSLPRVFFSSQIPHAQTVYLYANGIIIAFDCQDNQIPSLSGSYTRAHKRLFRHCRRSTVYFVPDLNKTGRLAVRLYVFKAFGDVYGRIPEKEKKQSC